MENEKSVKELLSEISEKLDEKNKKKKFSIPFKARVSNKKASKGWVTVLSINDNRNVSFDKFKIDEQTIMSDGIPRIATADETLSYKGKPFIILPSWSVKPWNPTENYAETINKGYSAQGHRLVLNKMLSEAIKPKRTISGAVIFFVILLLIVGGYFLTQRGGVA